MTTPPEQVEQLLATAQQFQSRYAAGQLAWQKWAGPEGCHAPPLVLLHGGFGSWNHWFLNLPGLRLKREVWTLDLPGLGSSGEMPEPYTTAHFAQLILSGIDQLLGEGAQFALGGFSFGAMIGGRLAAIAGSPANHGPKAEAAQCKLRSLTE